MNQPQIAKKTFGYYSVIFIMVCCAIYISYFLAGGSFIWKVDGFTQHFLVFNEYMTLLQDVIRGKGFAQWDWSIGAGADTIISYGYYIIGDPFVYLGVLFPESMREFSFHFLIFVRVWFVGASYLFFARKFNVSHRAGLMGALMYGFSFFAIYNMTRHPFFILPMIWYPLLCLGVEKILRKESGVLFSMMVAISAIANFYFFYKLTILTFIYGVVRYILLYGIKPIKQAVLTLSRCVLYYATGLLMSAILFLPMVDGFLHASRSTGRSPMSLFYYPLEYYEGLIYHLFTPGVYFWMVGGFSIFTIFTFVFLLKNKRNVAGVMLLILGIFTLFPLFASFMNGMSGPYNRFSFAIPLFLALASSQFLDKRQELQLKHFTYMFYLLVLFTLLYAKVALLEEKYSYYLLPIALGWLMWGILLYECKKQVTKKYVPLLLTLLVVLNMATNTRAFYYDYGRNMISSTVELHTAIEQYENVLGGMEKLLPTDERYRLGVTSRDNQVRNQFIYHDLKGLNTYLSLTNGYVADFAEELEIGTYQIIQPLRSGMDDRRMLNHLLNVEYIITNEKNKRYLPRGYEVIDQPTIIKAKRQQKAKVEREPLGVDFTELYLKRYHTLKQPQYDPNYVIAKTASSFPLAYVEDNMMLRQDFAKLNPVEKEVFLTKGVVVEDALGRTTMKDEDFTVKGLRELDYNITYPYERVQPLSKTVFTVRPGGGEMHITLPNANALKRSELYVRLEGLRYKNAEESTKYDVRFKYEGRTKTLRQSDEHAFSSYFKRDNMFVNLGYTKEGKNEITIQFPDAGRYYMDNIVIYALPVRNKTDEKRAAHKQAHALTITNFENERIEGTINNEKEGVLVTSIPYAKGWQVTVNGEKRDTIQANIGFIGIPLEKGKAHIVFTYQNPYLLKGSIVSIVGVLLLIIVGRIARKKRQ